MHRIVAAFRRYLAYLRARDDCEACHRERQWAGDERDVHSCARWSDAQARPRR